MPENVNTSALVVEGKPDEKEDDRPVMIKVDHVSMSFNMASEQLNSLKEYAVAIAKRKLFFEEFKALDDVSFEVRKGDVFGIMGTNGSGKSTMLKIIAGVLEPTKGTCQVNGNIAPLIELGAGFDMDLSARENIYLNGALLGYSKEFIDENFDAIVEFAEVEKFLDMPLKNYSSGMVARIAFAIATVIVPEILVVDEVLSVGDFMFQKKCEDRITELIEQHGVTVLIVSHSNDQIARLCNKAIWIEKGHERLQGDADVVCGVYGGLAGRTGKAESEERVFKSLVKSMKNKHPNEFKVIAGETSLATNEKMAQECERLVESDEMIIACDNSYANSVLATSFAGLLGTTLNTTPVGGLRGDAQRALVYRRPNRIYLFDCGAHAETVYSETMSLPWGPEVVWFKGDFVTISNECYEYGRKIGDWSEEIVLLSFSCNVESRVLAPYLYRKKSPVFMFDSDVELSSYIERFLSDPEVELLTIVGEFGIDHLPETEKIRLFDGTDSWECCLGLAKEMLATAPGKSPLFIAPFSLEQWPDLLCLGAYAGVKNGVVVLSDEMSLDAIANVLDLIAENRNRLAYLELVGRRFARRSSEKMVYQQEMLSCGCLQHETVARKTIQLK